MSGKKLAVIAILITAILGFAALGYAAMSTSSLYSVPIWQPLGWFALSGLSLAILVVYLIATRSKNDEDGQRHLSNKITVEDIQGILIELNDIRMATVKQLPSGITPEIAEQIRVDFNKIFKTPAIRQKRKKETTGNYLSMLKDKTYEIPLFQQALLGDYKALIKIFKNLSNMLDGNGCGFKQKLGENTRYGELLTDLAKKRLLVKLPMFKSKNIFQNNINDINTLSYGLASLIWVREVIRPFKEKPTDMKMEFEAIETNMPTVMNELLQNLTSDWRGNILKRTRRKWAIWLIMKLQQ